MNQTDKETEAALETVQENKLYKRPAKSYPEISAQQRKELISAAVAQERANLAKNASRPRVDLRSVEAVEAEIDAYLATCEEYGVIPTTLGLASSMGYSRTWLYNFMSRYADTESARLLDSFRNASAGIIAAASMNRSIDNATSIFLLKNSGQGLTDKQEMEITRGLDPAPKQTAEEIYRKYEALGGLPDC